MSKWVEWQEDKKLTRKKSLSKSSFLEFRGETKRASTQREGRQTWGRSPTSIPNVFAASSSAAIAATNKKEKKTNYYHTERTHSILVILQAH
jgi:hypothetical protein